MSEKKVLNDEELVSVSGGTKVVGNYSVYEASDFSRLSKGDKVVIYNGTAFGNRFTFLAEGKVTMVSNDLSSLVSSVVVKKNNSAVEYTFTSNGLCKSNNVQYNYWFGPGSNKENTI